ncbi:flavodoxin family protein [Acidothermaceae bacterium B102]|nr:flavodoxin family protein [Acidothermaceae bacterium B102]
MTQRLLGLGAGAPGGSVEIALKAALQAAESEGATVEWVRLDDLDLSGPAGVPVSDDLWWLWERLMEADGVIVAAPIISRTVPARLKLVIDRLLGPNADKAIVERLLAARAAGHEPTVPFRLDERVLRPRVAGLIAVGGSLTTQWKTLALPVMHSLTFSMQTAVVDQIVLAGSGTPQSVVLDDEGLARAAQLGRAVAQQLGVEFDAAVYRGEPGACPLCHLSVVELKGRAVQCATCGAYGRLADNFSVEWTDLDSSVITMAERRAHYDEILETAGRHAKVRDEINDKAAAYAAYDRLVRPSTH